MNKSHGVVGLCVAALFLFLYKLGICGCTLFALASMLYIAVCAMAMGNQSLGALTQEREKKTLDCLRLTQWSSHEILRHKLRPEFAILKEALTVWGPAVVATSLVSDAGPLAGLGILALGAVAGSTAAIVGLCLSSLAETTSQAYVWGRILKGCWLLLSPILDRLVSAVLVSTKTIPVFGSLNPLSSSWTWLMPESTTGLANLSPWVNIVVLSGISIACWKIACRRFDSGMVAAPNLTDRQVHSVYTNRSSWPATLRKNPAFARELAAQLRSGAGKWPGYAVFAVIFLAPLLYAQSWATKEEDRPRHSAVTEISGPAPQTPAQQSGAGATTNSSKPSGIVLRSNVDYRVRYVLSGHQHSTCLRMLTYQFLHTPLPLHQLTKEVDEINYTSYDPTAPHSQPSTVTKQSEISSSEAAQIGAVSAPSIASQPLNAPSLELRRRSGAALGLSGGICLLLVYLGIRCSGFLAASVTSERERSTWQDLQLSGISAHEFFSGKLLGALAMPMIQMTIAFPCLLLFWLMGSLSIFSIAGLWLYVVALAGLAATIGVWSSATSQNSHDAHSKALLAVILLFGLGYVGASTNSAVAFYVLAIAPLVGGSRADSKVVIPAVLGTLAVFLNPTALSPLSTVVTFMHLPVYGVSGAVAASNTSVMAALFSWITGMLALAGLTATLWHSALLRISHSSDPEVIQDHLAA